MNWSWTGFFAVMGVINLWVAYNFDTDTWVNFKLFGGIGLMAGVRGGPGPVSGPLPEDPTTNPGDGGQAVKS
jgi:hypothetical protein